MSGIEPGSVIEITRADGRSLRVLVTAVVVGVNEITLTLAPEPEPELEAVPTLDEEARDGYLKSARLRRDFPALSNARLGRGWHPVL